MGENDAGKHGFRLSKEFLDRLGGVTAKRPRTVIDHILQHGHVTTEELREQYGYDHPPRAARDVREQGIPLETFWIEGTDGRRIAACKFADPARVEGGRLAGRAVWPKDFKANLIAMHGARCAVCLTSYASRYLQIDHGVPFHVSGEPSGKPLPKDFMLLSASCNRAKAWSCEHCENWKKDRVPAVCRTCYWANPVEYAHIALRLIRRLDIVWAENEDVEYKRLFEQTKRAKKELPDFVKDVLRRNLGEDSPDTSDAFQSPAMKLAFSSAN